MKSKLFYGWYIVISGLVLAAFYSSIISYGWTAFVGPITATFGWSMAQVSLASSLRSLEVGVFNPMWGPIVDRVNPRTLMRFGVIMTSAGFLTLSQTRNLYMYYGGFMLVGMGSSLVTGILPLTVIARWFKRDMGKATGLFYMGTGIGGVSVTLIVFLIDRLGWSTTLLYGGIGFLLIGLTASFVMRGKPEDMGLVADGKVATTESEKKRNARTDFGTTTKQALKSRAFWHLAFVTMFQNSTSSTVMFYAIPYLTSLGMERTIAGSVVSLYTFISLFGRIPAGMLSDVMRRSYVVTISVVLQLTGLILYWTMGQGSPYWLIIVFAVPYGLGVAGVAPLRGPVQAEYFGTKNFGSIYGLMSLFLAIANVSAPPLAGWLYDNYHDYKIWWSSLIVFGVLALGVILTIPKPQRREETEKPAAVTESK
jgi:sugar phosphate permease